MNNNCRIDGTWLLFTRSSTGHVHQPHIWHVGDSGESRWRGLGHQSAATTTSSRHWLLTWGACQCWHIFGSNLQCCMILWKFSANFRESSCLSMPWLWTVHSHAHFWNHAFINFMFAKPIFLTYSTRELAFGYFVPFPPPLVVLTVPATSPCGPFFNLVIFSTVTKLVKVCTKIGQVI